MYLIDKIPVSQTKSPSEPITLVISEAIAPDRIGEYEAWTRGISTAAQDFDGFLGTEVLRPRDHAYAEYVVIVRFASYDHLRHWVTSPTYQYWLDKSKDFISSRSLRHMSSGMEVWFSPPQPQATPSVRPLPYYKKVVLGVLAVYPLILVSDILLRPILSPLPSLLGLLVSVTFVSALLTYPVMPSLTWVLRFWLYPPAKRPLR